jgi:hypothetical protein
VTEFKEALERTTAELEQQMAAYADGDTIVSPALIKKVRHHHSN